MNHFITESRCHSCHEPASFDEDAITSCCGDTAAWIDDGATITPECVDRHYRESRREALAAAVAKLERNFPGSTYYVPNPTDEEIAARIERRYQADQTIPPCPWGRLGVDVGGPFLPAGIPSADDKFLD